MAVLLEGASTYVKQLIKPKEIGRMFEKETTLMTPTPPPSPPASPPSSPTPERHRPEPEEQPQTLPEATAGEVGQTPAVPSEQATTSSPTPTSPTPTLGQSIPAAQVEMPSMGAAASTDPVTPIPIVAARASSTGVMGPRAAAEQTVPLYALFQPTPEVEELGRAQSIVSILRDSNSSLKLEIEVLKWDMSEQARLLVAQEPLQRELHETRAKLVTENDRANDMGLQVSQSDDLLAHFRKDYVNLLEATKKAEEERSKALAEVLMKEAAIKRLELERSEHNKDMGGLRLERRAEEARAKLLTTRSEEERAELKRVTDLLDERGKDLEAALRVNATIERQREELETERRDLQDQLDQRNRPAAAPDPHHGVLQVSEQDIARMNEGQLSERWLTVPLERNREDDVESNKSHISLIASHAIQPRQSRSHGVDQQGDQHRVNDGSPDDSRVETDGQ